jgi:hypothetical protein
MAKESGFDYREVDSFVPSKAYRRALFIHSTLLFSVRGEGAVFSKVKWSGLEAADASMYGAVPLLPHTLLQRYNKGFAAYVIKAQRGRRGMAPRIRNLSCIWKRIVDFTLRPKERAPLLIE